MLTVTNCSCIAAVLCSVVDPTTVDCHVPLIACAAMKQFSGSVGLSTDNDTNSSAVRPAQHSAITRLHMSAEVLTECISTHAVEAFFQQCAPLSTAPEIDLLNSLFWVAEVFHAVLPRSVSLQEWAHRRVPRGFERQVNSSGMVYVGDRFLQHVPHLPSEPGAASSAAQPPSDSIVAQPASVVEERVLDDDGRYDLDLEVFFQQCSATELSGPEVDLLNSLMFVAELVQAVLPRSVTLEVWVHRISSATRSALVRTAAESVSLVEECVLHDSHDDWNDVNHAHPVSGHTTNSTAQHAASSDGLANSSAERPAECYSINAGDNEKCDHHGASRHFTIFDDADDPVEQEPDIWDIQIQHAPVAPEGIGMVWHRYKDPDYEEDWFSCVPDPQLWCYEKEVRVDQQNYFRFQGKWQEVVIPSAPEITDASATAASHLHLCPSSEVSTVDISSAVQPDSYSSVAETVSLSSSLSHVES